MEYGGACYHVINRGNYRRDLFAGEGAAQAFVGCLRETCGRFGWRLHAYVVMRNHFHLAVETPEPNLSLGMKWLQGTWVARFNRFRGEERDATNAVTKRFYGQGQLNGSTALFYTKDHLGSVREMTDTSGAIRARYDYDPYGRITKVSGDLEADFGFTGFYRHQTTSLNLTLYRAYDSDLGRAEPKGSGRVLLVFD